MLCRVGTAHHVKHEQSAIGGQCPPYQSNMSLPNSILAILHDLLPSQRPLGLHEPSFGDTEKAQVAKCLDSGWVSSVGQYVDRFEQDLADYTHIPHAIATINGTAALHTAVTSDWFIAPE